MQKWEYRTTFVWASIEQEGVMEYLSQRDPSARPPKYTPEATELYLNQLGAEGWELVHMEPVLVGKNYDVKFLAAGMDEWTHCYFCVFKRPTGL